MKNVRAILENQKLAMRVCMILVLVFGIMMSFMVPQWQTPDEPAHVQMIATSLKNENMANYLLQDMDMEHNRIRFQYGEKINQDIWKEAITKAPTYNWKECMPKGIELSVVEHLPAAIGILLGILCQLPTFWVLTLGEVFSLIFYIAICGLALKIMPVKKEVMLMVMAFPMCMQQAASLNYDGVLLPLCFLYVAYIFYMRYTKERLGWKEVILTLLLLLLIIMIKIPYVFLALMVFLLPLDKMSFSFGKFRLEGSMIRKWRIPLAIVLIGLVALGLYLFRDNFLVQLVGGMILEGKRTLYLFAATAYTWGKYLMVSSVGQFGWLESALPFAFVVCSYILMVIISMWGEKDTNSFGLKGKTRTYIWIVTIVLGCFTVLSMVNHTVKIMFFGDEHAPYSYNIREAVYQIPYIGGLQGRYFLPFLALPFLALPGVGKQVKWKSWMVVLYILVSMVVTGFVLYERYWNC